MLQESRLKIEIARNPNVTEVQLADAQSAIEKEISRIFFAPLLCVVSSFTGMPVEIKDFSSEQTVLTRSYENVQRFIIEARASNAAYQKASPAAQALADQKLEKIRTTNPQAFQLRSAASAVRLVTKAIEQKREKIVFWLRSLDKNWLQQPYAANSTISNADVLHMSIAHEAIGLLFNIDSLKPDAAIKVEKDKEAKTHELGAKHFIKHVMEVKQQHEIPEFYYKNRTDLILAFEAALYSIGCRQTNTFSQTVGKCITEYHTRTGNKLKACPVEWMTKCPNDIPVKFACANHPCTKSN